MMLNTTTDGVRTTPIHTSDSDVSRAERWFLDQVTRAQRVGKVALWADLSPALAETLIRNHMPPDSNRRLRSRHVERLTRIITSGHWDGNSHQGIAFTTDGIVNDGQHRIHAARASGITVEMLMTFGQPRRTFEVIDQELVQRQSSDLVDMAKLELGTPTIACGIARVLISVAALRSGKQSFSDALKSALRHDILEFARANTARLHRAVSLGLRVTNGIKAKISPSNTGAALFLIARAARDDKAVERFVEGLATGADLDKGDPILVCREGLRARAFGAEIRRTEDRKVYETAAIITAWNLWRSGKRVRGSKQLQILEPDAFPVASP